jgi:hypothetical protein
LALPISISVTAEAYPSLLVEEVAQRPGPLHQTADISPGLETRRQAAPSTNVRSMARLRTPTDASCPRGRPFAEGVCRALRRRQRQSARARRSRAWTPAPEPLVDLRTSASVCQAVVPGLTHADRAAVLTDEYPVGVTVEWIVRHLLHDLEHHVLDIRRGYAGFALADYPGAHTEER